MKPRPNPLVSRLAADFAEVTLIRSRHDGVHILHSIHAAVRLSLHVAASGEWNDRLQANHERLMERIRTIDRVGFDTWRPAK